MGVQWPQKSGPYLLWCCASLFSTLGIFHSRRYHVCKSNFWKVQWFPVLQAAANDVPFSPWFVFSAPFLISTPYSRSKYKIGKTSSEDPASSLLTPSPGQHSAQSQGSPGKLPPNFPKEWAGNWIWAYIPFLWLLHKITTNWVCG